MRFSNGELILMLKTCGYQQTAMAVSCILRVLSIIHCCIMCSSSISDA